MPADDTGQGCAQRIGYFFRYVLFIAQQSDDAVAAGVDTFPVVQRVHGVDNGIPDFMFPKQPSALSVEGEDKAVLGAAVYHAAAFHRHRRRMVVAIADVGCPQALRRAGGSRETNYAILHGLAVYPFPVGREADGFTHGCFAGAPYGCSGLRVYGGQEAVGRSDEDFPVRRYRPHGSRGEEHTGTSAAPRPAQGAGMFVQRIQRFVPCAEDDGVVIYQRACFDVALHFRKCPYRLSGSEVERAEGMVACADVNGVTVYCRRAQHGFAGGELPQQRAGNGMKAINIFVGRAEDHGLFIDRRRAYYSGSSSSSWQWAVFSRQWAVFSRQWAVFSRQC